MKNSYWFKNMPRSLMSALALSIGLFSSGIEVLAQQGAVEVSPLAVGMADLQWTRPGGGNGFPVGVQTARQGVDLVTGGVTYYARFPAGSHFDLHWHTHDEYVVVVAGAVTIELGEEVHDLTVGSYVVIPGKLNHSWDVPAGGEDAVILVRRAGPADFHFVESE